MSSLSQAIRKKNIGYLEKLYLSVGRPPAQLTDSSFPPSPAAAGRGVQQGRGQRDGHRAQGRGARGEPGELGGLLSSCRAAAVLEPCMLPRCSSAPACHAHPAESE